MKKYTTTGNGVKVHLRDIKGIYISNGTTKVKYANRESNYAPYKTSCGRYDDENKAVNLMAFHNARNEGQDVCQVCLVAYKRAIDESNEMRKRIKK